MTWLAIGVLAAGAYGLKALGVVWSPPTDRSRYAALLPAALFAGLIVVLTFETDGAWAVDARLAGAVAAALAAWRKAPFIAVVAVAMAATALVRVIG